MAVGISELGQYTHFESARLTAAQAALEELRQRFANFQEATSSAAKIIGEIDINRGVRVLFWAGAITAVSALAAACEATPKLPEWQKLPVKGLTYIRCSHFDDTHFTDVSILPPTNKMDGKFEAKGFYHHAGPLLPNQSGKDEQYAAGTGLIVIVERGNAVKFAFYDENTQCALSQNPELHRHNSPHPRDNMVFDLNSVRRMKDQQRVRNLARANQKLGRYQAA